MAGYYSATQQHNAAAPLADFCTAAYSTFSAVWEIPEIIYEIQCWPLRSLENAKGLKNLSLALPQMTRQAYVTAAV